MREELPKRHGLGGTMVISVYLAPNDEARTVADEVAAVLLSLPCKTNWVLGGDWNEPPKHNILRGLLSDLGGRPAIAPLTTSTIVKKHARCVACRLKSRTTRP